MEVPGQRDIELIELCRNRIRDSTELDFSGWRSPPAETRLLPRGFARRDPRFKSWVREGTWYRDTRGEDWLGVSYDWFRQRIFDAVDLDAPEFWGGDARILARAEASRRRAHAEFERRQRERAEVIARARAVGRSNQSIASAMDLDRTRIHQIHRRSSSSPPDPGPTHNDLVAAQRHFTQARRRLATARRWRAECVVIARDNGMSYGAIATCLDVSRSRIQQLEVDGRRAARHS